MKKIVLIGLCVLNFFSCSQNGFDNKKEDENSAESVSHDMIVLGKQLENPYSVKNMTRAVKELYPTRAARIDVSPTDVYVRFLLKNEDEYNKLVSMGLDLMDHPLDYQIIKDGDYYHDPKLSDTQITWQYAVVKKDFKLPQNIKYEILDDCFIPDHKTSTRGNEVDWENVERESYRLTNNEEYLEPKTRGQGTRPKGRITIVDEKFAGGKPYGVAGLKVVTNSFVKFATAYTDRDGYYEIPRTYTSDVRYRLLFKNKKKFNIGLNLILVPASFSTLGKGPSSGIDLTITSKSNRTLFCRCVVNNAIYEYIDRCSPDDLNIDCPPNGFRVWILRMFNNSCAPMIHHGAIIDLGLITDYLGYYSRLVKVFMPDMLLGVKDNTTYSEIYLKTIHECAHASHFNKVGKGYWNKYIFYILNSAVSTGSSYGDGKSEFAGNCEIGEMWAWFLSSKIYNDRYGGAMMGYEEDNWFNPKLLDYLNDRGLTISEIFAALDSDVDNLDKLRDKLIELYPEKEEMIKTYLTK